MSCNIIIIRIKKVITNEDVQHKLFNHSLLLSNDVFLTN